jgi:phenylacetyl-CoA:acceptor oxidoreductase subunit 1
MVFGDGDDAESAVSRLLAETQHFRMHEELGTNPSVHYVWDKKENAAEPVR